jgi:hypothetical protein
LSTIILERCPRLAGNGVHVALETLSFITRNNQWKAQGICTYAPDETWLTPASEKQAELFADIRVGDMVILKKRQKIGETMRLYGHGRVTGRRYDANGYPELVMHW